MTIYCIKKTMCDYETTTVEVLRKGFEEAYEAEAHILSLIATCDDHRIDRISDYCDDDIEAPLYCVYYTTVCTRPYATQYIYTIEEVEI